MEKNMRYGFMVCLNWSEEEVAEQVAIVSKFVGETIAMENCIRDDSPEDRNAEQARYFYTTKG